MTWTKLGFDHAKVHAVPDSLLPQLMNEMVEERGHPVEDFDVKYPGHALGPNPKPITEWAIDFGGVWATGQPLETVHLDGLEIEIASDNVGYALAMIRDMKARYFTDGTPYYKLHHWHFCLVMTLDQGLDLMAKLDAIEGAAAVRADEWFDEHLPLDKSKAVATKLP